MEELNQVLNTSEKIQIDNESTSNVEQLLDCSDSLSKRHKYFWDN